MTDSTPSIPQTQYSYIYGLVDPRDNEIRYIGRTIDPDIRLRAHCRMVDPGKLKTMWILELKAFQLEPEMKILEKVDRDEEEEAEKRWVRYFIKIGKPLLNGINTVPVIGDGDFVNGSFSAALTDNRVSQLTEFTKLLATFETIETNAQGKVSKTALFGRLLHYALIGIRAHIK